MNRKTKQYTEFRGLYEAKGVILIFLWCISIQVEPKRNELAEANAKLAEANELLTSVQAHVAELNAQVQELESQFKAANDEKEAAILESEKCQRKLDLANRLINALASEGSWSLGLFGY